MDRLQEYRDSHKHPLNKLTHTIGIPTILSSLILLCFDWQKGLLLFVFGWILQVVGHLIEGNRPAFLSAPIHLLVGPIWWFKKIFRF